MSLPLPTCDTFRNGGPYGLKLFEVFDSLLFVWDPRVLWKTASRDHRVQYGWYHRVQLLSVENPALAHRSHLRIQSHDSGHRLPVRHEVLNDQVRAGVVSPNPSKYSTPIAIASGGVDAGQGWRAPDSLTAHRGEAKAGEFGPELDEGDGAATNAATTSAMSLLQINKAFVNGRLQGWPKI